MNQKEKKLWDFKIFPRTKQRIEDNKLNLNGLYCVGLFDSKNITISEQIKRANFLADRIIEKIESGKQLNIAVVGGGFAGLSFVHKFSDLLANSDSNINLYLFEKGEQLCPIQRGCSIRKYYSSIHRWPKERIKTLYEEELVPFNKDSFKGIKFPTVTVGDLASVKVTQVLDLVKDKGKLFVYQNCTYLKIDNVATSIDGLCLTFSGDKLKDTSGNLDRHTQLEKEFDIVILATGFGVEQNLDSSHTKFHINSYWRNDDRGQTQLTNSKNTYLVSGYGDGAINDILRLKLYDFNPYQLLDLFEADPSVNLDELKNEEINFELLKNIFNQSNIQNSEKSFLNKFQPFIKNQINVIMHVKNDLQETNIIKEVVNNPNSFNYNRLLLFALWCCNGFTIKNSDNLESILNEVDISRENIIIRHGSDRLKNLKAILSTTLYSKFIEKSIEHEQSNVIRLQNKKKAS